ncbi:hypothetical protein KGF56_002911 [Candida oxycetoniae]|uniref:CDC20/Fizzy WD40 domain-containing protein n=1 Tax=Candida oxycetoniae TaxID=497107 RepID=A0AAI9WXI3_9ASCO|nr:uncharacterized protein KGF56_002911 [Candida oxycetoniae]KAI3404272.2 hypothetical protein KGF56_002911 [Candida oxycetoniae]
MAVTGAAFMGDRFIPISSSLSAYKVSSNASNTVMNTTNLDLLEVSQVDLSLRDDSFYGRSILQPDPNSSLASQNSACSSVKNANSSSFWSPMDLHQEVVAEALDFKYSSSVLKFNTHYTYKKQLGNRPTKPRQDSDQISKLINKLNGGKKKEPWVRSILANDILQAPGLRNDYYSNLVSWSSRTNRVIVGLSTKIYVWGGDDYVKLVSCDNDELITAISCGPVGFLVLVGTANGKIFVVDQKNDRNKVVGEYQLGDGKCLFCFAWFDNERHFLGGDDSGEVFIFKITVLTYGGVKIEVVNSFKCHQQQICVGANDNCCTIWNLQDLKAPVLKFVLPHNAAIKALSYCPWTNSLLATGGGSKDRKIRFWHTTSGTLLNEFYTDGQITSLIWSKYKKEIVATFGFGGSTKSNLMRVYSYPDMTPTVEVNSACNLRILSAATSPDFCSICVASNDSTIRIYELWHISSEIASNPSCRLAGAFGSDIIELVEGIQKSCPIIR